jgi:hypothetical protein
MSSEEIKDDNLNDNSEFESVAEGSFSSARSHSAVTLFLINLQ